MPFDNPHQTPVGDLELLMDARSRIVDQSTWLKRNYRHGERHCLVAVLSLAAGSRNFNFPSQTERRLTRHLAKQLPPKLPFFIKTSFITARQRLMWFNDDARTSHQDVIALFDRTIEHLTSRVPQYVSA